MLFEGEHRKTNIKLFSGVSLVRGDSGGTRAAAARVRSSRASEPCRRLSTRPEARTGARISVARPLCFPHAFSAQTAAPTSIWCAMARYVAWCRVGGNPLRAGEVVHGQQQRRHLDARVWRGGGAVDCGALRTSKVLQKNIGCHVYIHVLLLEPPLFFVMRSICHQPILFVGYLCFYVSLLV